MPETMTEVVEADTAIGKFKVSGASITPILLVVLVVLTGLSCYVLYAHAGDSRESGKEIAKELKEASKEAATTLKDTNKELIKTLDKLTSTLRKRTCLDSFTPEKRAENVELCRRISQ